jgi:hypothetical protein
MWSAVAITTTTTPRSNNPMDISVAIINPAISQDLWLEGIKVFFHTPQLLGLHPIL